MDTKSIFMVVKIRFGRGPVVTRRKGKNSRIATLAASSLTLISICFASLGVWRLTEDVDLTGEFLFKDGLLSHWQVWTAAAIATQYGAWRLTRYAQLARTRAVAAETGTEAPETSRIAAKV
ncbi:MAG: hypothetical protein ABUS51_08405 [Acidobacteriota bacterium]